MNNSSRMAEMRTKYQAHVAEVLKLAGIAGGEDKAARIAWYFAFNVKPGKGLYLAPKDRVRVW